MIVNQGRRTTGKGPSQNVAKAQAAYEYLRVHVWNREHEHDSSSQPGGKTILVIIE